MGSKMRFLFLLGTLLVLFAVVLSGEDYQGKRGKHGFLQGKKGKHGFFSDMARIGKVCSPTDDCGSPPPYLCCNVPGYAMLGTCGFCTGLRHDSGEDYQGKRGKHGFFPDGDDYQVQTCNSNGDCSGGKCCILGVC